MNSVAEVPVGGSGPHGHAMAALVGSCPRGILPSGVLDAALLIVAYLAVLILGFDSSVPSTIWGRVLAWLPFAVAVDIACMWAFGLYGQVWRHASADEARRLMNALAAMLLILAGIELIRGQGVPWSMVFLGTGLGGFLLGAVRFQSRLFSFRRPASPGRGHTRHRDRRQGCWRCPHRRDAEEPGRRPRARGRARSRLDAPRSLGHGTARRRRVRHPARCRERAPVPTRRCSR